MSKIVEYQGCTILSTPRHIGDSEKWGLHIVISVKDIRNVRMREFSSDPVYATEQEAEIHGIAFGQRIIDGRVEGRPGIDIIPSNRRAMPRLRVQFHAAFSDTKLEGSGVLLDLSQGGCRIKSPIPVKPDASLALHTYASEYGWPLRVAAARVQWVGGQTFGLAFCRITDAEKERLGKMVTTLRERVAVMEDEPAQHTYCSNQVGTGNRMRA